MVKGLRNASLGLGIALGGARLAVLVLGAGPVVAAPSQQPEADLVLTPSSADFGEVDIGEANAVTITATNIGCCADVFIELVWLQQPDGVTAVADDTFAKAEDSCEALPLGPGASCTVRVTFTPTDAGQLAAWLAFEGRGTDRVALSGVGVSAAPATTTSVATTAGSSPTTLQTTGPTATTPTSVVATPSIAARSDRPWALVAAAVAVVVALLLLVRALWGRRGPRWVQRHVRALARADPHPDVEIVRSPGGRSPPTCVVRLEPHADQGIHALVETD